MALTAQTVIDIRSTGSDLNGGCFDPGVTGFATDLVCVSGGTTSSPVVSSASYSFVAGDVGAWLFIKSGTNWIRGWFQIVSVSGGQATLSAAAGDHFWYEGYFPYDVNNSVGCCSVSTNTGGTFGVDYSQSTSPLVSFTNGVISGTNTTLTSASVTVGKNLVGNSVRIASGTSWTVQTVVITATSGSNMTVDKSLGTVGATGGTGKIGGCIATPGMGSYLVSLTTAGATSAIVFHKSGTYDITSTVASTSGGVVSISIAATKWIGWDTNRHFRNNDTTRPAITNSTGLATLTMFSCATQIHIKNLNLNGNSSASSRGFAIGNSSAPSQARNCSVSNFTNAGFYLSGCTIINCTATGCANNHGFYMAASANSLYDCVSYSNTGASSGFYLYISDNHLERCYAYSNPNDGFQFGGGAQNKNWFKNCESRANTRHGFNFPMRVFESYMINCLAAGNVGGSSVGYSLAVAQITLINCFTYNNTTAISFTYPYDYTSVTNLASDPYMSSTLSDIRKNNNPTGGARLQNIVGAASNGAYNNRNDVGAYLPPLTANWDILHGGTL